MKMLIAVVACAMCVATGCVSAQEASVTSLPPSVVKTVPESGTTNIDAQATTQIKVTFSKEMLDGSWSWGQMSRETFPEMVGNPKYLEDKKTCVIDVKLQPKTTYVIWLNTENLHGFKDTNKKSSAPYLLVFQTK